MSTNETQNKIKYATMFGDSNPAKRPEVREKIRQSKWKGGYHAHLDRTREKKAIYNKQWQKDNPEKVREYALQYHYRKRGAEGSHTLEEWLEISGECNHCGATEKIERDHIIPLSKGGTNDISNIQPLCRSCNAKKHAKVDYPLFEY